MEAGTTRTTDPLVELEFRVRDRNCFFVEMSATLECLVHLEHFVNRSDGRLLEYFTIDGVAPDRVLSTVADAPAISDARLVSRGADGGLFEFVVSGRCVTTTLADAGAIAGTVAAERGTGRVVAVVPPHAEVRRVAETFRDRHPDSELVARRDSDRSIPVRTERGARATLADDLTERQREVLRTAYLSGYFAWPRASTADDCADALGIAQPTFSQHIRAAQERVFGRLFEPSAPER
ncbi:bacterio-opsin activator domain-containing protein [Halomarina halobia]|uniref:Bacterio-opsin activator domain-containing protein n=1 Tax=Halomarina halobia TaxID=3033386 RepID=A0ABD6AE98_9EURY|nr:bacterio-opsin activator domain-containing protein [Halomarina sp. PSR21]